MLRTGTSKYALLYIPLNSLTPIISNQSNKFFLFHRIHCFHRWLQFDTRADAESHPLPNRRLDWANSPSLPLNSSPLGEGVGGEMFEIERDRNLRTASPPFIHSFLSWLAAVESSEIGLSLDRHHDREFRTEWVSKRCSLHLTC